MIYCKYKNATRKIQTVKLFVQAIAKFILGVVLTGVFIFLPAGTLAFSNGWLFMALLFVPMFLAGLVMFFRRPKLLEKRLDAKEKQREQGLAVKLSGVMFVIGFIVAGLDFRLGLSHLPTWIVFAAASVFLFSYILYAEVLRENPYLSRTVELQENQRVVDTGLYGIVRHPMYTATLFLFLSMPFVLGSVYAFFVFMAYPIIIVFRIKNEEKLLCEKLEGYAEYMQRVKYRLVPFVW